MDELISVLKKIYIEKINQTFPPTRILSLFLFLIFQNMVDNARESSFLFQITSLKIQEILNVSKGPLANSTLQQLIIGIIATFLSASLYKKIKISFFQYLVNTKKTTNYLQSLISKTKAETNSNHGFSSEIFDRLKKELVIQRKHIINLHSLGEILLVCTSFLLAGLILNFHTVDLVTLCIITILVLYIQRRSFLYFLKELAPYLVTYKVLSEEELRLEDIFSEK